ncbi:CoA transferase [Rhizohabitans arisaemae]|uniref:CoA transferase n=1 Tax=Rhizohabitans arisaemae TaxID=2720610 RepID=UPI0024B04D06|nr:CoA transferase [Rhizohabitans arisaemae]
MSDLVGARPVCPLKETSLRVKGPITVTRPVVHHLGLLGVPLPSRDEEPLVAEVAWAGIHPDEEVVDEATAQAATGIAHLHGRRDGEPRGLAVDFASAICSVLTVQGLLAALIGRARGGPAARTVRTAVDRSAVFSVAQYLAAACADEEEAVSFAPGGPPFTTADGVLFEVEALDPEVWISFWRNIGTSERLAGSAWRAFQFRYATASSPLPPELHATTRAVDWSAVRRAAAESRASVCRLRTLDERAVEPREDRPWRLSPYPAIDEGPRGRVRIRGLGEERPLAGFTVLEAGRRIQAPLAAHVLGLLGADVIRIEPPGGDPLRGMPPACGGLSARWLALNRGKGAVEIDIKSASGRDDLRSLARESAVFLHNWAPGTAERLGLDHGDLTAVNPRLIYAYTGGWAGRLDDTPVGTDFMVQARTGLGEALRPADETPAPSLMTVLDVVGGLLGAEAILAALLLRETGEAGCVRVDSSLQGAAELLSERALRRIADGQDPRMPAGFRRPFRTADGWVALADDSAEAFTAGGAGTPEDLRSLTTDQAVGKLRGSGLHATAVVTALGKLPGDPRMSGSLIRDQHGALTVPTPWEFT